MSAFICSDTHILTLASAITESNDLEVMYPVAKMLLKENIKSVNYRYNKKTRLPNDSVLKERFFGTPHYMYMSDTALYKIAQCYDYQSCEHTQYKKSIACKLIFELMKDKVYSVLSESPDYIIADWAI